MHAIEMAGVLSESMCDRVAGKLRGKTVRAITASRLLQLALVAG